MEENNKKNEPADPGVKQKNKQKRIERLTPFRFKPGVSGNPNGRPKGKSLKEYTREYFANMTEKERVNFLNGLSPEFIWRMAEGNPKDAMKLEKEEREEIPNPYEKMTTAEHIEHIKTLLSYYEEDLQREEEAKKVEEEKKKFKEQSTQQEPNQTPEASQVQESTTTEVVVN